MLGRVGALAHHLDTMESWWLVGLFDHGAAWRAAPKGSLPLRFTAEIRAALPEPLFQLKNGLSHPEWITFGHQFSEGNFLNLLEIASVDTALRWLTGLGGCIFLTWSL